MARPITPPKPSAPKSSTSASLSYASINESQPNSLLLIHGAFSSHHEWDLVANYLPSYHLLIPDLPGHGRGTSSSLTFSMANSVDLLAELITTRAHDGQADVVGLSFGGYSAICLASKHPELVKSIFASGCHLDWRGKWKNYLMGLGLCFSLGLTRAVPKSWYVNVARRLGLVVNDELYADMYKSPFVDGRTYRPAMQVVGELKNFEEEIWETLKARTLLVVGGKEPYPETAGDRGDLLIVGNKDSKAVRVDGMMHGWNLQNPELFANAVMAWAEVKELPNQFLLLKPSRKILSDSKY